MAVNLLELTDYISTLKTVELQHFVQISEYITYHLLAYAPTVVEHLDYILGQIDPIEWKNAINSIASVTQEEGDGLKIISTIIGLFCLLGGIHVILGIFVAGSPKKFIYKMLGRNPYAHMNKDD